MSLKSVKTAIATTLSASCLLVAAQASAQEACVAPPSWTSHAAVPTPSTAEPMSLCAFHQWSWNMFLWITQDAGAGRLRFQEFATVEHLFDTTGNRAFTELAQPKLLALKPRSGKGGPSSELSEINQAGSRGILVHQSKANPDVGRGVYYSINVNDAYYDFVRSNGFQNPAAYAAAPDDMNFKSGATEFKYSWKIVEDGEDTSGFFTTDAEIELLTQTSDGTILTDPSKTTVAKVALVGVHVAGVVDNHPEMIWATFEHKNNAPDLPSGVLPTSDKVVSEKDWTFYKAGTPASASNLNNSGQLKFSSEAAQLLSPATSVFRRFAWGGGSSENSADIQSLNASVLKTTLGSDPIWQNYHLIGAVWGPSSATEPLMPNQVVSGLGSTKLSNSTIETFTQEGANCFTCHSTFGAIKNGKQLAGKNMNVSHIMTMGYFRKTNGL